MLTLSLGELAERLGCTLHGDPTVKVNGVSTLDKATSREVTFLANVRYALKVKDTQAAAVIASEPLQGSRVPTLLSANPYLDFARTLAFFYEPPMPPVGIHPTAVIAPDATVGPGASIGPYVVIGSGTTIGARATLHPHAVIYQGCRIGDDFIAHAHVSVREFCAIGDRVTLQNGVTIGGDGFGFAKDNNGRQQKIVQSGRTVIEDDVEVQTLTSIDRATMGETRVKRGAKIDSLCQIGHNCVIGEDNIICGQTGLAGSTTLEENVIMAGQTGSAGHITIHKDAVVWAQSGLNRDVPAGTTVSGYPAFDANDWLRASAVYPKLPEMLKTTRLLERRVAELERRLENDKS